MLFAPGAPSRIPIAAITGTNGKTTTARMLAHIHKLRGETVGLTTTDGVYINGVRSVEGDMTGPVSAQMVLRDPSVSVAVLETARGGMLRSGMGYNYPDVACCLNVSEDHLGLGGIDTLEQLALVKRIPIEVAREAIVLNADDEHCLRMADYSSAKHVWYVTMNPKHDLVREHIRSGGKAVAVEQGINGQMIALYDRGAHLPLLWTHLVPATLEGKATHNVQNAMFAAAMAYAMGVKLDDIRHGLRTFDTTFFQSPGRMNVFDGLGFKVIMDYGHNAAAVQAMCTLVENIPANKRVCVLSCPGDRRNEDIRNVAHIASRTFDHIVVRRDDSPRGRSAREVPELLQKYLIEAGFAEDRIHVTETEIEAVPIALNLCLPGDILLVFCDKVSRTWKQIIYHQTQIGTGTATPGMAAGGAVQAMVTKPVRFEEPYEEDATPPAFQAGAAAIVRDERGVRLARGSVEEND